MRRKKPTKKIFQPKWDLHSHELRTDPDRKSYQRDQKRKIKEAPTLDEFLKQIHGNAMQIKLSDQTGYMYNNSHLRSTREDGPSNNPATRQ